MNPNPPGRTRTLRTRRTNVRQPTNPHLSGWPFRVQGAYVCLPGRGHIDLCRNANLTANGTSAYGPAATGSAYIGDASTTYLLGAVSNITTYGLIMGCVVQINSLSAASLISLGDQTSAANGTKWALEVAAGPVLRVTGQMNVGGTTVTLNSGVIPVIGGVYAIGAHMPFQTSHRIVVNGISATVGTDIGAFSPGLNNFCINATVRNTVPTAGGIGTNRVLCAWYGRTGQSSSISNALIAWTRTPWRMFRNMQRADV